MTEENQIAALLDGRNSCRGFTSEAIDDAVLDQLFSMAQRAPSWCNIQPWRLALTSPQMTKKLSEALLKVAKVQLPQPEVPFPIVYPEPYDAFRKKCGGALYGAMGIAREDKASRYDAWLRNYEFFGAPHLVVVTRDKRLGEYATLDVGVWLGTLLVAAESLGIQTCPMASVAGYPGPLREVLKIPENEVILFGLALGKADPEVPANAARTTREEINANLRRITHSM